MQRADSFEKTLMLRKTVGRGEGDDTGWDGWMSSLTHWTWVWASSGRWWRTGRPGVLQSVGSQRLGHDWVTEQCRGTRRWRRQEEFLNIGGNRHVMKFVVQWESIMFVVSASAMVVVMAVGRQRNNWGSRQAEDTHGNCICIKSIYFAFKSYLFIHSFSRY